MRRTPLRSKGKPYKPAELKRFHDFVASLGCVVCGAPAEVHHVTAYADKPGRLSRSDWLVVGLCPAHHRCGVGRWSVEQLGHQRFFQIHGVDLFDEAMRLADTWRRRAA